MFYLCLFFLQQDNEDIQLNTVKAVGSFCLRYNEYFLNDVLKEFYHHALVSEEVSFSMKLSVLRNIEMYITEVNINIAASDSKGKMCISYFGKLKIYQIFSNC